MSRCIKGNPYIPCNCDRCAPVNYPPGRYVTRLEWFAMLGTLGLVLALALVAWLGR